jgi:hypothetical protein
MHAQLALALHSGTRRAHARARMQDARMDGIMAESYARPAEGAWEVPHVAAQRDALLAKGANQGWLIARRDLQLGRIVGAGTFGQTYEAEWRGIKVRPCCSSEWIPYAALLCALAAHAHHDLQDNAIKLRRLRS